MSLAITAVPFCFLLLSIASAQFIDLITEQDIGRQVFLGYDKTYKRVFVVVNFVSIVCYSIAMIVSLYFLEQKFTDQ